jgi:hypothetical protein
VYVGWQKVNAEDAANVAVEYVGSKCWKVPLLRRGLADTSSGLDNLPSEVTYLLGEIAEKDAKITIMTLMYPPKQVYTSVSPPSCMTLQSTHD